MTITNTINDGAGDITLSERLTFSDTSEFRNVLNTLFEKTPKSLKFHLSGLKFMDSSGLGMLIVAHNECQQRGISMSLYHPVGNVKELLKATKSYQRFHIID